MRDASTSKEAFTLFGLSGKKHGNGYSIENSKQFFVVKAIGDRAEALEDNAVELLRTPAADREIIQQGSSGWCNYKDELGMHSNCKLLCATARETMIKAIDEHSTVWQLSWAEVAGPEGEGSDLCTKDVFFVLRLTCATHLVSGLACA